MRVRHCGRKDILLLAAATTTAGRELLFFCIIMMIISKYSVQYMRRPAALSWALQDSGENGNHETPERRIGTEQVYRTQQNTTASKRAREREREREIKWNKSSIHLRRSVVTLTYTCVRRERDIKWNKIDIHLRQSVVTLIYKCTYVLDQVRDQNRKRERESKR